MEHIIFVSYKFADSQVANLDEQSNSIVRNYVDKLESLLGPNYQIYKGEYSGENPSEETVWEKLRARILDSTTTLVFFSPGMKAPGLKEDAQWMHWEVSFSLQETQRRTPNGETYTGAPNAMLAVVLPDENGAYNYYLERSTCCTKGCTIYHNHRIFAIMRDNMFNRKAEDKESWCHCCGRMWTR